jgi:hypothetical protein
MLQQICTAFRQLPAQSHDTAQRQEFIRRICGSLTDIKGEIMLEYRFITQIGYCTDQFKIHPLPGQTRFF